MAYRDPAKKREVDRTYYVANREKRHAQNRAYYAGNPQKAREQQRGYRAANRERIRARQLLRVHGMRPEDWAALWDAQQGLCYLCGEELDLTGKIPIDHDHDCCPRDTSCPTCWRGLAHDACNTAIGLAGDDPARLRRLADALEAAQHAYQQRKAEAVTVTQALLFD